MSYIPIHTSSAISSCGVAIKSITPHITEQPKTYPHSDDYYIFGLVNGGNCTLNIDFQDYDFTSRDIILIRAGQVHKFISYSDLMANMLIVDSVLLTESEKRILERCDLPKLQLFDTEHIEQLITLMTEIKVHSNKTIIQRLASVVVALIVEQVEHTQQQSMANNRYKEITLLFRELLGKNLLFNHKPSFYAGLLNISTAYLNECVKKTTGQSVSVSIQNEIMLLAKRRLAYTTRSIKEIAIELGFDDYSYFTRLFTNVASISPSKFRKLYHE